MTDISYSQEQLNPLSISQKDRIEREERSFINDFIYNLRKNKVAVILLFMLLIIVIASLCAPLSPYDPDKVSIAEKYMQPSSIHWFGTDDMGRDYFTRALYGGRVSLSVGLFSMIISTVFGVLYGSLSGYAGGKIDAIMMRFVDVFMSIPSFVLIVVINAYVSANITTLIIIIAIFSWMSVARITRAGTMSLKERDFVMASENFGASKWHVLIKHIIPNMTSQIIVASSISMAQAILTESALSFMGFGVQLPKASWGSMLQSAQKDILKSPLLAIYPGLLILITVMSFNLLGDVLRETLEPRNRK
ncbi:ABC transporter permease [Bariatricus sp. HCP28S3_A7]|uniref:ABC transporter permease n=1 Tax=Bariatricus sp. HCP28S3_A7 TaxID=3438894 RepID=UPI003F8861F9